MSGTYDDITYLKSVDITKTQKFKYLENETFFLQIENSLITHERLLY